jgi:large subunit ribosomal protein L29
VAHRISKQKKEIAGLNAKELHGKVTDIENHLFQLRMQLRTGQLPSPAMVGLARKELARVKTALSQKAKA